MRMHEAHIYKQHCTTANTPFEVLRFLHSDIFTASRVHDTSVVEIARPCRRHGRYGLSAPILEMYLHWENLPNPFETMVMQASGYYSRTYMDRYYNLYGPLLRNSEEPSGSGDVHSDPAV